MCLLISLFSVWFYCWGKKGRKNEKKKETKKERKKETKKQRNKETKKQRNKETNKEFALHLLYLSFQFV